MPPLTYAAAAACLLALAGPGTPDDSRRSAPFDHATTLVREIHRLFGDEARILGLEVWPDQGSIAVQDPRNPAHVDRYEYGGGSIGRAEPVAVGRNQRQIEARLFRLRDVDLSILPAVLKAAPDAVQAEEGRVTHAVLERLQGYDMDSSWGPPRWRVYVEGPRSGGYVEYRLDGKRGRVVKW